jgi:hypothetical protein
MTLITDNLYFQEFIYTFGTSLFCFAAWVAQFSDLSGFYDPKYAWRYDAQIAAAVRLLFSHFITLNIIYC